MFFSVDAPLTTAHAHEVVKGIADFKQFCKQLCIAQKDSIVTTLQFYIEEPYFKASWKKIALALYHAFEDKSINNLFHYMKSPPG